MADLHDKLADIFAKAKKINEAVWDGADAGSLDIPRLKTIIERLYNVEITIRQVDFPAEHLRGLIEVYHGGKQAKVYIRQNQEDRWKRFVTVKELCHVIIDRPEDWSHDGCDTIERLVLGEMAGFDGDENNGLRSEVLAERVALELAYPHEHRWADLERVRSGQITTAALAEQYNTPDEIIQRVLRPRYLNACDYFWRLVSGVKPAE